MTNNTQLSLALKLPRQAAPIQRFHTGGAAIGTTGVTASGGVDWGSLLGSIAQTALPIIAGLF